MRASAVNGTVTGPASRLLGTREAGTYLGISHRSVDNLILRGQLTPIRLPGLARVLLDVRDLDALVELVKADRA